MILDPAYPAARLIECLQAAKPCGWLQIAAAGSLPDALEKFISASSIRCRLELSAVRVAALGDPLLAYSTDDPGIAVGPDDLAYVAFTSGSTGRPKGVLGRHGPLSHFLPWQEAAFHLGASDRFSMLSGLSHDPLQRDMFTPLWLGATILIPNPEIIGTPGLARWMAEAQVTFAHLTPAMAEVLTETAAPDCRITSLRYAFFLGDKLRRRDVARLRLLAPEAVCIASYGTTETQRAVGYHVVPSAPQPQETRDKAVYPLGRGVDDVQLLVLAAEQQLAGVGELGEIYLRSPHLAQGYLGDGELTRTRFLTNPFTGLDADRLYKTGDMGRFLPDGDIEFLGRTDDQVKIRGFRIEPGEIEAALNQHPGLRDSVVVAREDFYSSESGLPIAEGGGENPKSKIQNLKSVRRLVAYVVAQQQPPPTAGDLRDFLKQRLPDYMVPSIFTVLDALPRTAHAKLDRGALPAPDGTRPEQDNALVEPRTPAETALAKIWAQVLRLERVGVHDNFFDLGGHSLLATQVISRVREAFQVEISLRSLFETPTIAAIAGVIQQAKDSGGEGALAKITPISRHSRGMKSPL